MKIYEIGTGYTPIPAKMGAATEIVVEELTRAFLQKNVAVEIIDIASSDREPNDLPITEVKVPSIFTKKDVSLGIMHKLKRVVYSVRLASKLKKILKTADEKVVFHFHNQYNLYFFLKLTSKKLRRKALIAYTVHSYIWGTDWEKIEKTVKKKYFQEVYCVKKADAVFVLNDITVDHFTKHIGVNPKAIHKIINGVNTKKYFPLNNQEIENLKSKNELQNKKIIFQVGSVCERKNQLGSVQMLKDYLASNKDVVFMYAGGVIDVEYQWAIMKYAEDNGISEQVKYLGELSPGEELNQYYNISDCSVFTSTLESFGLVIIEAISCGTPVVLGSKPMFDLDKGYLVYNNPEEFIAHVDKLLKSPMDKSEFNEVTEKYNWDSVASIHKEIFNRQ